MKLAIITFLEKHSSNSVHATATHFNIEPKQVRDWQSKKENLMHVLFHIRKLNNERPPKYPKLENEIYGWMWHYYNDWLDNSILTYTKTGCIQHSAYNLVAQWILQAWNNINPNLIRKAFKCCVEVINLMSKDNTDNEAEADPIYEAEADPIHKYEADSDNDNEVTFNSRSEDDYYKAEEINYINDWT
ncbi:5762_t:CDS:2 [Cetraspora pellucida]|uniref:5762_t:CDS:1 n=1 Tax=Cetraspora pellucida TaxID=1433469 RepID=A0A9N9DG44_9GLOM|nr:5762_t:CDS:2 [Cetraspora pellucida]